MHKNIRTHKKMNITKFKHYKMFMIMSKKQCKKKTLKKTHLYMDCIYIDITTFCMNHTADIEQIINYPLTVNLAHQ